MLKFNKNIKVFNIYRDEKSNKFLAYDLSIIIKALNHYKFSIIDINFYIGKDEKFSYPKNIAHDICGYIIITKIRKKDLERYEEDIKLNVNKHAIILNSAEYNDIEEDF